MLQYSLGWILPLLSLFLLTFSCDKTKDEHSKNTLYPIESIDFEHVDKINPRWKSQGDVEVIQNGDEGFLKLVGDGSTTTEWYSKISLDSTWRRVRISGKVKIPSLSPQAQFGKTARLYTAFYSADGGLLSFTGDINFTHLTWRYPFDEWKPFEHSFNLPKYLDNRGDSKGNNVMDLRFQLREAEGELLLDDISIDIIPEKHEMTGKEFHKKVLPQIKAKEEIGATITPVQIEAISHILHVDNQEERASDENDGSQNAPFLTLKKALTQAIASKQPTKIIVHEGDYMEENQIVMQGDEEQALLVIEGEGDAQITGSQKLDKWEQAEKDIYVHEWLYKMGETEQIWGGKGPWGKLGYIKPPGLRKELILANGKLLQQVFNQDSLVYNSFFIDEDADKLWVKTVLNLKTNSNNIEAGVLGDLLNMSNRNNMVLRNLSFINGAKFVPFGSVEFSFCKNILIEDCKFLHNNSTGLLLNYVEHVTVRGCQSNHNGWNGMKFEYAQYIRSEDNEFSYNGWRANMGDLNGWDLAANKNFNTHHVIIDGVQMYDNRGNGLWFDWCNSDITIKNVDIVGNYGNGIYYEVSQGPAWISEARISHNGNSGITVAEAWNLTIEHVEIYDNHSSQLEKRARLRTADDNYSAPAYTFDGRNLTVKNTTISSIMPNSYLTEAYSMWDSSITIFQSMMETYYGNHNRYFHSVYDTAMTIERHRWANQREHDRVARGGRVTLDNWSQKVDEQNAQWDNVQLPRIRINGLPEGRTLRFGEVYTLDLTSENTEVNDLKLGWVKTTPTKGNFKYFLSEFTPIKIQDNSAKVPEFKPGTYALVAYGTANGKLIQSNRIDIKVTK